MKRTILKIVLLLLMGVSLFLLLLNDPKYPDYSYPVVDNDCKEYSVIGGWGCE